MLYRPITPGSGFNKKIIDQNAHAIVSKGKENWD
jgi:hypothetical protein